MIYKTHFLTSGLCFWRSCLYKRKSQACLFIFSNNCWGGVPSILCIFCIWSSSLLPKISNKILSVKEIYAMYYNKLIISFVLFWYTSKKVVLGHQGTIPMLNLAPQDHLSTTLKWMFRVWLYLMLLPPYLAQYEFSIPWKLVLDITMMLPYLVPHYHFFFFISLLTLNSNTQLPHITMIDI